MLTCLPSLCVTHSSFCSVDTHPLQWQGSSLSRPDVVDTGLGSVLHSLQVIRQVMSDLYLEILRRLKKKSEACSKGCDCGGISKRMNCSSSWVYCSSTWGYRLTWRQAVVLCAYSVVACRTLECPACHWRLVWSSHLWAWVDGNNHWVALSCSSEGS